MKYISILLVMMLFLSGCTKMSDDLSAEISNKINEALSEKASSPTYNHEYYFYSIEPSVGRIDSTLTSNTFSYNGTKFIMNLNIPNILGNASEDSKLSSSTVYENSGEYIDYNEVSHHYDLYIYEVSYGKIIQLTTDYMVFYSVCSQNEVPSLVEVMLDIAKTIKIDENKIKVDYSDRELITYKREQLELFKNITPENGAVDELFDNNQIIEETETNEDGIDGDYNAPSEEEEDLNNSID